MTEENNLEKNIKQIEVLKEKLKNIMIGIDNYHKLDVKGNDAEREYKANLDARESLTINLNYYQKQIIIDQNEEMLKCLRRLYH